MDYNSSCKCGGYIDLQDKQDSAGDWWFQCDKCGSKWKYPTGL